MKTILNLIITTLGVLFILSACGGGAAPTITIGVVNQTCSTNAFSPDCDDGGQIERTEAITDCVEKGECDDNIPDSVQTCLTDLFGDDCDAVAETIASRTSVTVAQLQKTYCEANKADENCPTTTPDPNPDTKPEPTLVEVCTDDPFNSRCLTEYNGARETACRANNTPACADTITRFCETEATPANGNTLNSLCGAVKYNEPREVACRTGSHDLLCGATITRFCETEAVGSPANVFNPLCATYENAREIACRTGNYDSLCGDTITRFCETEAVATPANVFNSLCGAVKYNEPREVACRTGNHDSLCGATIMRYCEVDAANNPDNTFNPLCNDNRLAMGVRDAFCKDTGNNNANPFSMRCVENAEGLTARNNYCGVMATDATANAFEMRCADNAMGLTARNTYCVIGGGDLTGNAFKAECALNPDAHVILLASSECMGTTVDSYPLGEDILFRRGCLATLEAICRAGVTSFDTRCESVTTERCGEALGWLYEPLCAGGDYQARRETACLMEERPDALLNGCRDTVYLRFCGGGAENPFDTAAGATGMINCLALENNARRHGVQDYANIRQSICGNSRPVPGSKFETECNSLITNLCNPNPFDADAGTFRGSARYNCYTDGAFDMQRKTVRIRCSVGTTSATDSNCFDLAVLEPCTRDPLREECDPEEFKDARTARTSYCEGVTSGTDSAPNLLCGAYRAPFCDIGADGETGPLFNPIAPICPNDSAGLPVQVAYCSIGNNWNNPAIRSGCNVANVTFGNCFDNPFKRSSNGNSVCATVDPKFGLAALANRVKFCSGDVADEDLNLCTFKAAGDSSTQDILCMSSGKYANPFVDFCAGVEYDANRADFLTSCQDNNAFTSACPTVLACMENPYGEDCIYHRPYYESRWAIVEACAALEVGEYDATCTEDIRTNIQQDCLVDPYAEGCKDNRDYTSRRTARVDECKGYGSSKSIRDGGGMHETRCRVAFNTFCTGDKLFTTDGVECFTDAEYGKGSYLTDRNMHLTECQKAASARAPRTVCTEVSAHICVSAESEYTNPFLPLCDEDGRNSLVDRQTIIARCQPLNTTERADMNNESCEIIKAKMVLMTCDDNPFHVDCTDYSSTGQAYFNKRIERVMACGEASETGARCDGTRTQLCVSDNTAEAAPLSPACDNEADIVTIRNDFLEACAGDDAGVRNCSAVIAMNVKTACDDDPYVTAVSTADGSMVNCMEFDSYDLARETRLSDCEISRSSNVCTGTINTICLGDGEDVNPFNAALCGHLDEGALARAKRTFCQFRANVGNNECAGPGKVLTRPTTAAVLASVDIGTADDVPSIPTSGANQTNEFLKGTDDGLNTAGFLQANGAAAEVITINMATAEYDGEPLGGDSADGIAFFVGHAPDNRFRVEYYAGILAGADLGAVLEQEVGATVNWYGAINWAIATGGGKGFLYHDLSAIGTTTRDFVLEIDLGTRKFRSFFQRTGTTFNDGAQGFLLTGGYHATTGVITDGKVLFGVRSGDEILRNGESGATYHFEGPLIGIIGQEGALGVFYAQRSNDGQGDALGGGFVARPPRPDFFSWTLFAVDPAEAPLTIRSIADAGDGEASFIRGGTEALDVGAGGVTYTLTLADDYSKADSLDARFGGNIVTLGGDAVDGISFALDGDRLYSGLLAGTNLGAPTASASYQGRIGILIHKDGDVIYDVDNEFTLNANLGLGTFNNGSATFSNGIFQISGGKFNQFGLISGTVTLGGSTGTLSGLIGEDGVVGTFISTVHTDGAFAGGFVARVIGLNGLTSAAPRDRITEIWRVHAVTDDGTALDVLEDSTEVDSDNPPTNFIVGGTGALELGNAQNIKQKTLKTMDDSFTSTRGDTVRFDGDSRHGVAFARAIVLSDAKWYAGLLSGTRLTSPVSHTAASAQWVGQFGLIRDGLNNDEPYIAPFVLNVDFKGRRIYTSSIRIPASVLPSGVSGEFVFSGNYDGHGIIRGTVGYKNIATGGVETDFAGTLTGLIGVDIGRAETAIGAFVSDSGTGAYAGGFVAREVAGVTITEKVAYGDWVHSFGTPPPDRLDTVTRSNQFLAGERDRLNEMGANNPQGHTIFIGNDEGSFDGVRLDLDRVDGMSYFSTTIDGTDYFYAGIFSDADLGEPVGLMFDGQPTGKWNGRFGYRAPRGSSTDFTLEINFANSSIEAFVAGKDGNHFHLNGGYDANGAIINGTVDYGLFTAGTRTPTATRTPNGTLTGIIGQQGAIGAFISHATGNAGYAGGFLATPTAVLDPLAVKYSDWADIFDTPPPNKLDADNPHPQFLGTVAGDTELDETDAQEVINDRRGGITLADSFTDITFVGDAEDGVSFFWDNKGEAGYTGILAGTDLGAPFTQGDGPAKVTWEGWFQAIVREAERKFDLEIDFNNNGKKTIEAFVQQTGNNYFHLTGEFDANGVITGEVYFGTFINGNKDMPTNALDPDNGFLTGLIGEDGAVGAFVGGIGTKDAIEQVKPLAYHNTYAGGFVASPNVADRADYISWTGSFTTTLTDTMLATTARVSQFLATAPVANALDEMGAGTIEAGDKGSLNLANATFKGAGLGGQAADRVSWFLDSTNNFGYAGILSSTDLGLPLMQTSGTAKWNGHFRAIGGVSRDFILNINFDNNGEKTIDAFVFHNIMNTDGVFTDATATNYYHLTGEFDDKGVITGKVNYGTFSTLASEGVEPVATDGRADNGILTGLIGVEGAVGTFISGTGDKNAIAASDPVVHYAGGFVAKPTDALDDNVVNYDDWARSFATLPPNRVYQTGELTRTSQFVVGKTDRTNELGTRGVESDDTGTLNLADSFEEITFAGAAADGVNFFWDAQGTAGYAGILAGTNLGAPLTQDGGPAKLFWNGQFREVVTRLNREFVLEIDFDNNNKIEAFVQHAGDIHFHITGNFDAKGVITGKVNYGAFNAGTRVATGNPTARPDNGILTGLIGMEGAVGAFVAGTGTKDAIVRLPVDVFYTGGFVAHKDATSTGVNVKFNDWVRSFNTAPETAPSTTFTNQFLQGTDTTLTAMATGLGSATDGTGTITPTLLDLSTATYDNTADSADNPTALGGDLSNGVGFFEGYDTTNGRYFYAGIFNGADLGAPLTAQTAAGVWHGQLQMVGTKAVNTDFTLEVTFGAVSGFPGSAGGVSAFIEQTPDPTYDYYLLTGTYDSNGVITGTVDFGGFTDGERATPTGDRVGGTLTGLIGQKGAIGAFHSTATGSDGYAGGFVACRYDTTANACQQ